MLVLFGIPTWVSPMSKHSVSEIGKQDRVKQKPSATTEALRKGFADAVKAAVKDHRAAGRPVHEAAIKPRGKR